MSNKCLSVFNPFSLQSGPEDPLQIWTQKIIWYAESRFRQVLLHMEVANVSNQKWMQKNLYSELVSRIFDESSKTFVTEKYCSCASCLKSALPHQLAWWLRCRSCFVRWLLVFLRLTWTTYHSASIHPSLPSWMMVSPQNLQA